MKSLCILSTIGLLLCLSTCTKHSSDSKLDLKSVESELRLMESGHRAAIDNKNIESVLQFYAEDLITISPEEKILYGNQWISNTMNELYSTYDFHEDFKFVDIRIHGKQVAASFTFRQQMTPLSGGNKITQAGKGMAILKRSGVRQWQFEWNCYSYDNSVVTKQE